MGSTSLPAATLSLGAPELPRRLPPYRHPAANRINPMAVPANS
ncbi:MAG: hypothetical protein V1750_10715 [Acidobacteriota bacterium]